MEEAEVSRGKKKAVWDDGFPEGSLLKHLEDLGDPRVERTKKHKLIDLVAIAICGVIGW